MLTHTDHRDSAVERTAALLDAAWQVRFVATLHHLLVPNLNIHQRGARPVRRLNDGAEVRQMQINIGLALLPVELLRWAAVLGATGPRTVFVNRPDGNRTLVWLEHDDDTYGLWYQIGSELRVPADGPRLPGIEPPWGRKPGGRLSNDGRMSVADLRTVLTELGYPVEDS